MILMTPSFAQRPLNLWRMIKLVYFGNAATRILFPGVADFFKALQSGLHGHHGNPIFYVSSSAWNMYDVLSRFIEINHIPSGSLFLRDIEFSLQNLLSFSHAEHKREQIDPILQTYPELPFILIGDSGQQDPEIYEQVVSDYPGRILCIYIRNVSQDNSKRTQAFQEIATRIRKHDCEMILVPDSSTAAQHAAAQGWIQSDAVVTSTTHP